MMNKNVLKDSVTKAQIGNSQQEIRAELEVPDDFRCEDQVPDSITTDHLHRLQKSVGNNRDTDGLGTMTVGPFVIGSVDVINGEDGKEVPEFVATRHELKHLAEYWARERLERDFYWFVSQSTGSSEWRQSVYIDRRLNRLSELLGPEATEEVHHSAIAAFRKSCSELTDEDWHVFTEGTEEEQEAWRENLAKDNEHEQ